jgi:hypothetical protein
LEDVHTNLELPYHIQDQSFDERVTPLTYVAEAVAIDLSEIK